MVIRPSSSQWSISPETIMSHHYRLTRGIKPVVDTSPPYSMYNSPISVHYLPKRSSSADPSRRRQAKPVSQPHRELADFVNSSKTNLKLPLALTSSFNDLAKPKLLANRNYQPPLHRKKKPPIPPFNNSKQSQPHTNDKYGSNQLKTKKVTNVCSQQDDKFYFFKNAVFDAIIERHVYSDKMIVDTVENEVRLWVNYLSKKELDYLKEEIYNDLNIRNTRGTEKIKHISSHTQDQLTRGSSVTSDDSSVRSSEDPKSQEEREEEDESLSEMSTPGERKLSSTSSASSSTSSSNSSYSQSSSSSSSSSSVTSSS